MLYNITQTTDEWGAPLVELTFTTEAGESLNLWGMVFGALLIMERMRQFSVSWDGTALREITDAYRDDSELFRDMIRPRPPQIAPQVEIHMGLISTRAIFRWWPVIIGAPSIVAREAVEDLVYRLHCEYVGQPEPA